MKIETANLERQELHDLLGRAIAPFPIAFISTIGENGIYNAAPFSCLAPACWKPPIYCVAFGLRQGQKNDTLKNIEYSQDFVINIMDETLIKSVIQASASYPSDVDEIKEVGLTSITADKVKSPLVAESQVSLECRLVHKLELGEGPNLRTMVFGEVMLVHIKDELWVDGNIEPSRLRTVGRIGSGMYGRIREIFEMKASSL